MTFLEFSDRSDIEKPQRFQFFWHCETALQSFFHHKAPLNFLINCNRMDEMDVIFDMAATLAVPGLFSISNLQQFLNLSSIR